MKDIAYCNTQFKRFAKYFNGFVEKKQKYYIGFCDRNFRKCMVV